VSQHQFSERVLAFANASSLDELPEVVDVTRAAPVNPPEKTQVKFVGRSYAEAYEEAESFVTVVDDFAVKHGPGRFADLTHIIDFGAGWGRITRTLLTKVAPTQILALDVDPEMTALLNMSLPGVNALTISPQPPSVLGQGAIDAAVAFSVFSHLSGPAHEAWAAEFARVVAPGGIVAITVLDASFFATVAGAQEAVRVDNAKGFAENLATTFPDIEAAQRGYANGEIQYAGSGGGEIRTGDYYGWAVAPPSYIERVWGAAGFTVVEWIPSGTIVSQAVVVMVRGPHAASPTTVARTLARRVSPRLRNELRRGVGAGRRLARTWTKRKQG